MKKINNEVIHDDEYQSRINKANQLIDRNISPWPNDFYTAMPNINTIKNEDFTNINTNTYQLSGRIRGIREHGKSIFITISDDSDHIQLYAKNEELEDSPWNYIKKYLDIGDIIQQTEHYF